MRKLKPYFLALLLITSIPLTTITSQAANLPTFQQYRSTERSNRRPAPVNLNSPGARRFRTVLTNGAKQGPNFAGHYTVVIWGCGTSCQSMAIVDAKNGRVYMQGVTAEAGVKYQINSRLLIVNPPEELASYGANKPDWLYSRYYVWENNRLRQIYPATRNR